MQNSPIGHKIAMPKRPRRLKCVSINGNHMSVLQNASIETLETRNQKIAFGRVVEVLGAIEKAAAKVESETAGGNAGKQSGTMNDVDSKQRGWLQSQHL